MASLVLSSSPFTSSIHPSLALKPLVCKRVLVRVCMCINPDISSLGKKDNSEDITQLHNFVQLNIGCWNGTFKQFDAAGNMLAAITTKLKASPYGRGEFTSLYQTLSVKQPKSGTVIAGSDDDLEWFEYQVDEIDIFTIDKKHKLGYFHNEKAYCLSHPTAEMLNVLLRAGLLGDEDDEHQEFFEGVKLPCRRPALVTESCLYSEEGNSRVRAFHVLNAQGLVDTIGIFYEERESEAQKDGKASGEGSMDTWEVLLGEWSGHAVTRRTGTYGSTFAEEEVKIIMRRGEHGNIVQEIESSYAGVNKKFSLEGAIIGKTLQFTGGLTSILLPNGITITFPVSVGKSVTQSQSFALEFCWITTPQTRRRIIRTYDMQGTVVSTTASNETRC